MTDEARRGGGGYIARVRAGLPFALVVFVVAISFGKQFWINILLTILGYIPGIVHAVWVIAKY